MRRSFHLRRVHGLAASVSRYRLPDTSGHASRHHRLGAASRSPQALAAGGRQGLSRCTTRPRGSVRAWAEPHPRSEARWRLGELWPRSEALPSLGGASVRSRMVGSGAISLISGGSMKHVVVDVAEEGGIHQIRGRYGEIQRFSSRFSSFVC